MERPDKDVAACRSEGRFINVARPTPGITRWDTISSVAGLQKWILDHPEIFVSTLTEKLLTFGTGRGVEYFDGPAVRKIVRDAAADDYRFSSIVIGIVNSTPFRMRQKAS